MGIIKLNKNSTLVINFIKVFVIIMIICIVFCAFMFAASRRSFDTELRLDSSNVIDRLTNTADISFRNIEYVASKLNSDAHIQAYMYYSKAETLYPNIDGIMQNTLKLYKDMNRHIESIYVCSPVNATVFTTSEKYSMSDFHDSEVLSIADGLPVGSYAFIRDKENVFPNVITFIHKSSSDGNYGEIIINVTTESIVSTIVDTCDISGNFYILDEHGNVLYTKKTGMIGKPIQSNAVLKNFEMDTTPVLLHTDGKTNCVVLKKSSFFGWNYVHQNTIDNYARQLRLNNRILMFPIAAIFICGLIISLSITFYTYRPISQIIKIVQDPNSYLSYPKIKNEEVNIVASKTLLLINSNEKLKQSLNKKIALLNDAQLTMLQAQINPHFLYNVLNVLNGNIAEECGYNSKSIDMVLCLSKLLRYALNTDKIIVPVKQELSYLKKYVQLLKYRYTDLFCVEYEIDNAILECKILKMSLQPLVENCVEHGFANKTSGGIIKISGVKTDVGYSISVSDNGCGITNFDFQTLFNTDEQDINFNSGHIGLGCVIYRYRIVFNKNAEIKIDTAPENGTKITINIIE